MLTYYIWLAMPDPSIMCGNCISTDAKLRCGACRVQLYCNKECQVAHWQTHKMRCKIVQTMRAKLKDLPIVIGKIATTGRAIAEFVKQLATKRSLGDVRTVPVVLFSWKDDSPFAELLSNAHAAGEDLPTGLTRRTIKRVPVNSISSTVFTDAEFAANAWVPLIVREKVAAVRALGIERLCMFVLCEEDASWHLKIGILPEKIKD